MVIQMIGNDFYDLKKDVVIFYKTLDMEKPKFLYQESPSKYPGLVAVMAQFLPTFESPAGDQVHVEANPTPQKKKSSWFKSSKKSKDATGVTSAGAEQGSRDGTENGVVVKL